MNTRTLTGTIDVIAFDADDTLWHDDHLFSSAQTKFKRLLGKYQDEGRIQRCLYETDVRNLEHFGYGVKGFTLSMIETAIELTDGRITGREVQEIIGFAKEMLGAPIHLLDGVRETVESLAKAYGLMIITKGDLRDQEAKIMRSGLGAFFRSVEIVSRKDRRAYEAITAKLGVPPERFLMVGNSLKSDILPVLAMGGRAVYIPYQTSWEHEMVSAEEVGRQDVIEVADMRQLLPLLMTPPGAGQP